MHIHREGKRILLLVLALLLMLNLLVIKSYSISKRIELLVLGISTVFYCWMVYFFRDPAREVLADKSVVLGPADGRVLNIQEVYEEEYFKEKRIKISIFMSPFNVHVNRNPIAGIIKFFKYHPGKYWVAFHPKASKKNEHTTIVIENEDGLQVLFRQIAGFVARRIKFYAKEGEHVEQGKECGFIKFGSRADVFLPPGMRIQVAKGDRIKGGVSVLATASKNNNTLVA